jgi:hypothetical protein
MIMLTGASHTLIKGENTVNTIMTKYTTSWIDTGMRYGTCTNRLKWGLGSAIISSWEGWRLYVAHSGKRRGLRRRIFLSAAYLRSQRRRICGLELRNFAYMTSWLWAFMIAIPFPLTSQWNRIRNISASKCGTQINITWWWWIASRACLHWGLACFGLWSSLCGCLFCVIDVVLERLGKSKGSRNNLKRLSSTTIILTDIEAEPGEPTRSNQCSRSLGKTFVGI